MKITTLIASLVLGYLALCWAGWEIIRKTKKDAAFAKALYAKYHTPLLSAAEIAELHASRWMGD